MPHVEAHMTIKLSRTLSIIKYSVNMGASGLFPKVHKNCKNILIQFSEEMSKVYSKLNYFQSYTLDIKK